MGKGRWQKECPKLGEGEHAWGIWVDMPNRQPFATMCDIPNEGLLFWSVPITPPPPPRRRDRRG